MDSTIPRAVVQPRRIPLGGTSDFDEIFARYLDPVYRFLYSRVGNREDAEDLASEVFLKAARQLDTERSEASIAQWLFTVARTVLADHWRRYYRGGATVPLDDPGTPEVPASEPQVQAFDSGARRVAEVLDRLPEKYRSVLELRFLRGYTIQETAEALGVTPNNVKVIQHRALVKAVQVTEDPS